MTITLAPKTETRLRRKTARLGEDASALVETLLADALADEASEDKTSEAELREEYRQLVTLELRGPLSPAQTAELQAVTQKLEDLDQHSPAAQAMSQRLDETGQKLDQMLAILRRLPPAEPVP